MNPSLRRDGLAPWLKWLALLLVALAPLAFGSGSAIFWLPLYATTTALSAASWVRARFDRSLGRDVPRVPGRRWLAAILGVALLQMAPLPAWLLKLISPGSWAFHFLGRERTTWHPLSVSPGATSRGILCVAAAMALYAFAFREYGSPVWRRRVLATLATTAALLGAIGMIQAASDHPLRLYGLYDVHLERGWGVWGPYLNRNHLAGYIAVTVPLGIGLAVAGTAEFRRLRKRFGIGRALGSPAFPAALTWASFALFLIVATLAPHSRGALLGLGGGLLTLLALSGHVRLMLVAVIPLAAVTLGTMDFSQLIGGFEARGFNRQGIWLAALPMLRDFPVFGAGLNTFLIAFTPYQVEYRGLVLASAAHNDYLQVAVDMGLAGVVLAAVLGFGLVRAMWRARGDILTAAAGAAVAAALAHALVDYALQTPANAAAFAVLCGVLLAGSERPAAP